MTSTLAGAISSIRLHEGAGADAGATTAAPAAWRTGSAIPGYVAVGREFKHYFGSSPTNEAAQVRLRER